MAAEVTSKVEYIVTPNIHVKAIVMTYSKASATDYITLTNYGIRTVLFADCRDDTGGADDPCTLATSVVTLSSGTGAGRALIIGSG